MTADGDGDGCGEYALESGLAGVLAALAPDAMGTVVSVARADACAAPRWWLGPSERRALPRLRLPKRRQEWLAGRWAAKRAVSRLLGPERRVAWSRLEVVPCPTGAPAIALDGRPLQDVGVSIAHAGGVAGALAWPASDRPLGLDLEPLGPIDLALHAVALNRDERAWATEEPGVEHERTLALWTAKEALLKVSQVGLRTDLRRVRAVPGNPWRVEAEDGLTCEVRHVARGGYLAAVAAQIGRK